MNRTGLLAAVAVMLASSPSFAQFGGMGGMGGGMGGMGGQAAPGTMMQGGRFAGAGFTEVQRSAQVEMEGGQLLSGKIDLRPVIVDGDLGQYVIAPDKIKMIRFLKPVERGETGGRGRGEPRWREVRWSPRAPVVLRAARRRGAAVWRLVVAGWHRGLGMVADPNSRTGTAVLTRGKVITTADKEIIGMIHIPTDFRLELDFGALTLAPVKLRSITFTDDNRKEKPAKAEAAAPAHP